MSNYSYGLDQGIPPEFTAVAPVGLIISGAVYANFNDRCQPVPNAEIIAWQLNSEALSPLNTIETRNYRVNASAQRGDVRGPFSHFDNEQVASLRSRSCRGQQHTDSQGLYSFQTTMPPSYGPPRHVMVTISAPGFQTVTTRVYFDRDWRLQQLTTDSGNVFARTAESPPQAHGFPIDHEDYATQALYPGKVAADPRVAALQFRPAPLPANAGVSSVPDGLAYGHFEVTHDFFLAPVRSAAKDSAHFDTRDTSAVPPFDVRGLWSDTQGGLISVETHGNVFIAREVPHPRTWHVLWGYLVGNTVRGVHFQSSFGETRGAAVSLTDATLVATETIQVAGSATGVILPTDPFQSNAFSPTSPQAMTIEWSGGDALEAQLAWSKQDDRRLNGSGQRYRYLKLLVFRVAGLQGARLTQQGQADPGQLRINEIDFFEGLLANEVRPRVGQKLQSARFPFPFVVTCSSFLSQDRHCYKAFDGDDSSHSQWTTQAVGLRRNVLAEPQWVLFDFGAGHTIQPTAIRIVCDAANTVDGVTGASGCPMTFAVQGSNDNVKFDTLYRADLYDYAHNGSSSFYAEYPRGGRMFYFPYDSLHGRANGQRCGSCDVAPSFTCHRDAFDVTCDSRYCGVDGRCAALPVCAAGQYLHVHLPDTATAPHHAQLFRCEACPAGRYGDRRGVTSVVCSGPCAAGHFCPAGSTSATQFPCDSYDPARPYAFYCPVGSGSPLRTASGQRTVLQPAQDRVVPCDAGAYCTGGVQYPCPVGRFGARGGLADRDCTAACPVGYFCSQTTDDPWAALATNRSANNAGVGNVNPAQCPPGSYCPDGRYRLPCPAGTFGNVSGLRDAFCSGLCSAGHYCPAGSVSAEEVACPAGRYGDARGWPDANCAGPCPEGYFCPLGTAAPRSNPCGGPDVYCPVGSAAPTRVAPGFYTAPGTGGVHYRNQTHQRPAERGFYAQYGRRFACPAGSFGNETALSADQPFQGLAAPTAVPTTAPSPHPTVHPSRLPSSRPSAAPTAAPSYSQRPSLSPAGDSPTLDPTQLPTLLPTLTPTAVPTAVPSEAPSRAPTAEPTWAPSAMPTQPTAAPSYAPTSAPSSRPSAAPTATHRPTRSPTPVPTAMPTLILVRQLNTARPTAAPTPTSQAVLTTFHCSGRCAPGHFCPRNSTSARQRPCPAGRYGATSGLRDAYCTAVCPLGHYCPAGSVRPLPCPPGNPRSAVSRCCVSLLCVSPCLAAVSRRVSCRRCLRQRAGSDGRDVQRGLPRRRRRLRRRVGRVPRGGQSVPRRLLLPRRHRLGDAVRVRRPRRVLSTGRRRARRGGRRVLHDQRRRRAAPRRAAHRSALQRDA